MTIHKISLVKGEHLFVFCYEAGREEDIIAVFVEMAIAKSDGFNWSDVAVLSFQVYRKRQAVELGF